MVSPLRDITYRLLLEGILVDQPRYTEILYPVMECLDYLASSWGEKHLSPLLSYVRHCYYFVIT